MKATKFVLLFLALMWGFTACDSDTVQPNNTPASATGLESLKGDAPMGDPVVTGAESLIKDRLSLIKGTRVGIVANQTSLVFGGVHLVDTLKALGINITKVFAPEHGFRGDHDAGAAVKDSKDTKTGIPIVSLYGKNKKPSAAQLADVDLVLFDIQDVGARFYTYISTLAYVMEACGEQKKSVIVLDRPNPNGWYVEGPVLEKGMESFVGMHRVPIVHGMTVGEYANMVNGEGWLSNGVRCILEIIPCVNYNHNMKWEDTQLNWVAPSPNLPTPNSAYLYPVLCWMEGMPVSVGRGTDQPFELFGAPWHEGYRYQVRKDSVMEDGGGGFQNFGLEFEYVRFTPRSIPGKSANPKFKGKECYGARPTNRVDGTSLFKAGLALLKNFQTETGNVDFSKPLFTSFFPKLVGTKKLAEQVKAGASEEEIWESWQADLGKFKATRAKYLLYDDFGQE